MRVLEGSSLDVLWNVASGTPYTQSQIYDEVGLAALARQPVGPLNSRYGPWTQSLDFKASKSFGVSGLDLNAYVWVLNAFDTKNAITIFTGTGSPFSTGFLNTPDGQAAAQNLQSKYGLPIGPAYTMAQQNQSLFNNPSFLELSSAEHLLYVSDASNHVIRTVPLEPAGVMGTVGVVDGAAGRSRRRWSRSRRRKRSMGFLPQAR